MLGRQGPVADGGAVDADRPTSLVPGLELFVHTLLFDDDGSQGVGHLLEHQEKKISVPTETGVRYVESVGKNLRFQFGVDR